MKTVRNFRHLYGWRNPRLAEQPQDIVMLQSLFTSPLPELIVDFLKALSDCVLYYAVDVRTRTGRTKRYSHFVSTNIGPDLASPNPFPSSLINRIQVWRKNGLSPDSLPMMATSGGSGQWIFCRLLEGRTSVVVPKGDREFGTCEKEWNEVSCDLPEFFDAMTFDASPLISVFRIAGALNADDSIRELLTATMGSDWETQVTKSRNKKRT